MPSCALVVGDSVAFEIAPSKFVVVGAATVALEEALTEIELEVVVTFPSVAFCEEVPLTSDPFVKVPFGVWIDGVAVVALIEDVIFSIVRFPELIVLFDVMEDFVALETRSAIKELFMTLPFLQKSDKLPVLAISQCFVRFNAVPLHGKRRWVLFDSHTFVKLTWT